MKNLAKTTKFSNKIIKKQYFLLLTFLIFGIGNGIAQNKTVLVGHFEKVIVSPHIQVNFEQGNEESVIINDISVDLKKLNIDFSGKTLHVYLEGAKTTTKNETTKTNNQKIKHPIYNGTIVKLTIIYKTINDLSLRGEEDFVFKSKLKTDKFQLKIYGESRLNFNDVQFNSLHTTIYGEAVLNFKSGKIGKHKITSYGESKIKAFDVVNESAKLTAYGEAEFELHVVNSLKVTAYGEAVVEYKGNPEVNKGIVLGEATIRKVSL
ncbi:MAG: DUF2807 domain-containing protein [Flavobacteriaceae bacterium]|nr:DUF2807 domain-containing protein [Flavobacteriaceae bacterium]